MNRQSKYRGIKSDGSGWVYGHYYNIQGKEHYILEPCVLGVVHTEVIPETVGMFIQSTIPIELHQDDIMRLKFSDGTHLDRVVVYDTENMRWGLMPVNAQSFDMPMGFSFGWIMERISDLKIIGTIHDHLLKTMI